MLWIGENYIQNGNEVEKHRKKSYGQTGQKTGEKTVESQFEHTEEFSLVPIGGLAPCLHRHCL
jgi:hypothetical protein